LKRPKLNTTVSLTASENSESFFKRIAYSIYTNFNYLYDTVSIEIYF